MTTSRIRILQIASGDLWAGAEVQVYNLCKALNADDRVDLSVVLMNHGVLEERLRSRNIRVEVFDESRVHSLAILRRVAALVRRIQPDIVHTHRLKENVIGGLASLAWRKSRCLNTVHGAPEHSVSIWQPRKKLIQVFHNTVLRLLFARTVLVSGELQALSGKRFTGDRCQVIPNGIDIQDVIDRSGESTPTFSDAGPIKVGFLGRLVPVKRLDLFLAVAKQLVLRSRGRYRFHIIGDGPLKDDVCSLIDANGLAGYVTMHGFCENPLPVLKCMDYLLVTSDHEGLPTNVLEAMCLKVEVVSRDLYGISQVLGGGKYGKLVSGDDAAAFADVLENDQSDAEGSRRMRELACKRVVDNYGHEAVADSYKNLYYTLTR